jgi:hypothetical protein
VWCVLQVSGEEEVCGLEMGLALSVGGRGGVEVGWGL